MPEVTGVRERRGRARVWVDGEFWAELDPSVVAARGLREGAELTEGGLAEARIEGERPLAMDRALNLLGYRSRSSGEMRSRLERHGYAAETVEAVVWRLAELGYLDDDEFARGVAREKARKRYGPRRVFADLRRGGVDAETAGRAVEEEFEGRPVLEEASEAAARRYNTSERSDAAVRRVYGFLARRGYPTEVCAEVARRYRDSGRDSD